MPEFKLEECKLFAGLGDYQDKLLGIKKACSGYWENPQHRHYTKHGITHSEKIIERLEELLKDQKIEFNSVEAFILLASCFLHDIGMQCVQKNLLEKIADIGPDTHFPYTYEPLENIRSKHAELSSVMIKNCCSLDDRYDDLPSLGLEKEDGEIVDAIARVSKAHSDENYKEYCDEYDDSIPDCPKGAKLFLLAVLLRLGDALDADRSRCERASYLNIESNMTVISKANYWKHHYVPNVKIDKGRVKLVFGIPQKFERAKSGIRKMAEKYICMHMKDLATIWDKYDVRIALDMDSPSERTPNLTRNNSMPPDVEEFFINYNGSAKIPEIPENYRTWILGRCQDLDIDKLVDSRDSDVLHTIKMPQIYIPLYTNPPWEREEGRKVSDRAMAAEQKQQPVDIEELVGKNDYLLVKGQAGSGKTTMIKHIAYTIINKENGRGLDGYLPVWVVLNELQKVVKEMEYPIIGSPLAERFLEDYFKKNGSGLDYETIKAFCAAGKVIFLIDGLDEIDSDIRDMVVLSLSDLRKNNKMVLSSRPHGVDVTVNNKFGNRCVEINPLTDTQINGFIENWFKYDTKLIRAGKTSQGMIGEMKALEESHQDIKRIVDTPLMLTAACILYHYDKKLPDQRAELLEKFINNLIHKRFADPLKVLDFLMRTAFEIHKKGTARKFDRVFAIEIMEKVFPKNEDEDETGYRQRIKEKFDRIENDCGLLRIENNQYLFWHLSFQEFLAARNILDKERRFDQAIADYWDQEWYQEVIKLFIGYLSYTNNNAWANGLVEDILKAEDQTPFRRWRLAAQSLMDIHQDNRDVAVVRRAQERLQSVFELEEDPRIKADAGEILGWLGDNRDLEKFVTIEGGKYNLEELGEKDIASFEIGKYPVTNRWYQKFVKAGGYENKDYWTAEGRKWLEKEGAKNPRDDLWHDRKWKCPNAPVVGVSWYEAAAFCNWLTEIRNDGYMYRLPTEEEWQTAAAGKEGREYPWGKDWGAKRCNAWESKIERTSSVGIFIDGNTPGGVADLSGNIWEWMRTDYKTKKNREDFKFDLEVYDLYIKGKYGEAWELSRKRENTPVLRGGSWDDNQGNARCASRRFNYLPYDRDVDIGFRCLRTP